MPQFQQKAHVLPHAWRVMHAVGMEVWGELENRVCSGLPGVRKHWQRFPDSWAPCPG
jgi:hypothetical protein